MTRSLIAFCILAVASLFATTTAADSTSYRCTLLAAADSLPGAGSSCWGYVNPANGNEYAIFGTSLGTAIFNVVNPTAPYLTGFISGPSSSWREMKTYQNYCYVGTEGGGGLQIINLANPEAPVLAATYTGSGFSSTHSVTIDTTKARLYANGANGGMRILSLANPVAPVQVGNYTAHYVHDSYARNDTVWAACIGSGTVRVLRTTNPLSIQTVVAFATEQGATHNCWPTEDRQYLLATDETSGGRVSSWDISDVTSPIQVETYTADPCGDTHNVHVRGNLAYIAHYAAGLQVVDVSDPTNIERVGYYDTYTGGGLYKGAWGVYPYFPSGTIVISDISSGMILVDLDPNSLLKGTVTDAVSGLPIPYAEVRIAPSGEVDSTDANGEYKIWVEDGSFTVVAKAFGHDSVAVGQSTTVEGTTTQNFALASELGGSVSGFFRTIGGSGIANAVVRLQGTPLSDATDGTGAFLFSTVPNGTYTASLAHWTSLPDSASVSVSNVIGNTAVDFTMEAVAFAFNFEDTSTAGWAVNVDGNDNATAGAWERVNPRGETPEAVQPPVDHTPDPLTRCWVTGQGITCRLVDDQDVDGGKTTLFSPVMDLSAVTDPTIQYFRWYSNSIDSTPGADVWKAQISSNGGSTWMTTDSTSAKETFWKEITLRVSDYVTPTSQVRMRFIADDAGTPSIVEAGIDDFRVWGRAVVGIAGDPTAGAAPIAFAMHANVPNPFNPKTEIRFDLPRAGAAHLAVFSLEGRLVRTLAQGALPAGRHAVVWDGRDERGRDVASGPYLLRLEAGSERATRKILLAK